MPKYITNTSTEYTNLSSSVSSSNQKLVVQAETSATNLMELSGSGTIRSYVNSSGTYVQSSGVWNDLIGEFNNGPSPGGDLTYEAYGTTPNMKYFFRHDQANSASLTYQMRHGWDSGTNVKLHGHFIPMSDPAGAEVIVFSGTYCWSIVGQVVPTSTAAPEWVAFSATHTVNPGDVNKQFVVGFADIPPSGARESSILLVNIARNGPSTADTYTTSKPGAGTPAANLCGIGADVHYRVIKPGSEIEFPT